MQIKIRNDIPDDEILSFETGDDLDRYLLANPNSTEGGIRPQMHHDDDVYSFVFLKT